MKTIILLCLFTVSFSSFSQEKNQPEKKEFFKKILGNELESSIVFMPIGSHTVNPDIVGIWYTSYNYKSFEVGVFKNSYKDWTMSFLYKRSWKFSKIFSVIYGGGFLFGYNGKLKNHRNIPLSNTFLYSGNVSPVVGLNVDYKISKKLSIHSSLTPLIFIYGLKYYL